MYVDLDQNLYIRVLQCNECRLHTWRLEMLVPQRVCDRHEDEHLLWFSLFDRVPLSCRLSICWVVNTGRRKNIILRMSGVFRRHHWRWWRYLNETCHFVLLVTFYVHYKCKNLFNFCSLVLHMGDDGGEEKVRNDVRLSRERGFWPNLNSVHMTAANPPKAAPAEICTHASPACVTLTGLNQAPRDSWALSPT